MFRHDMLRDLDEAKDKACRCWDEYKLAVKKAGLELPTMERLPEWAESPHPEDPSGYSLSPKCLG